jgi:ligand-binding sensor domain-containing protein
MKLIRFILIFCLLMGLNITARNQDSRIMESVTEGVFIVKAVYVDRNGVKWFGTNRGLCRYNDLAWRYYTDEDYLAGNQVNALAFEQTGNGSELWVATTEGVSVVAFDADGVTGSTTYTAFDGILDNDVADVAVDSRHGKFFGSAGGITWFHGGVMDTIAYDRYYTSILKKPVRQMDIYSDTLYIAQDGGIGRLVSGVDGITGASRWTPEYGMTPFSGNIRSVMVGGIDQQYFGTDVGVEIHSGYAAKENWELLSHDDGLVHNDVISIAEDGEGGLWFGTLGGASHYADGTWTSYTTADGLLNDTVYDIGIDLDGSVWFATGAGACRLREGTFQDFITAVPDRTGSPLQFNLFYNHGAGSLHIAYCLEESAKVTARLYNTSGILVGQWAGLPGAAGDHQMELELSGHSMGGPLEGIYVMQLIQGNHWGSQKLMITL